MIRCLGPAVSAPPWLEPFTTLATAIVATALLACWRIETRLSPASQRRGLLGQVPGT